MDFAGNGRQDVIITHADSGGQPGQVTVLVNHQGLYQESSPTFFGGDTVARPGNMVIADFNGDGVLDVFIPSNAATQPPLPRRAAAVEQGCGRTSLEDDSAELRARSNAVQTAAAADVDGDGATDLFLGVASSGSGSARRLALSSCATSTTSSRRFTASLPRATRWRRAVSARAPLRTSMAMDRPTSCSEVPGHLPTPGSPE